MIIEFGRKRGRAGEQLRRLAVVTRDVRILAKCSASTEKDIKNLIADDIMKAVEGDNLIDQISEFFNKNSLSMEQATDCIKPVQTNSLEHNQFVHPINSAISQMDSDT